MLIFVGGMENKKKEKGKCAECISAPPLSLSLSLSLSLLTHILHIIIFHTAKEAAAERERVLC
jgi:hypothetical protein